VEKRLSSPLSLFAGKRQVPLGQRLVQANLKGRVPPGSRVQSAAGCCQSLSRLEQRQSRHSSSHCRAVIPPTFEMNLRRPRSL
jgi:hypothetical protein